MQQISQTKKTTDRNQQKKETQPKQLSKADLSLEKLKITTSLFIRQYLALNPDLNLFLQSPEDRQAPAETVGTRCR